MHIVIAAHDLYPDPGSGGTGRYVYETSRRLVDAGHQVSVVTRRRGDVPERESIEGIDVYRYDIGIAGESAPSILQQLPSAVRSVSDHARALSTPSPPDIVSFQGPVTSLLLDRVLDTAPRIPTFHSPWPTEYAIKTRSNPDISRLRRNLNVGVRWVLERSALAQRDHVIVLSSYMRDQLREVYGGGIDATVIPGGVDVEQFTPDAGPHGRMKEGEPAFLTVRRLSERMGHDRLLNAFASVRDEYPNARLYIAGDGPLRNRLERQAEELGIFDSTTFLGYVPDSELPAAYASADFFVLPTQELEGFGLATLEALASGTPVVATPVGGTVEVLDGLDEKLPARPLTNGRTATDIAEGMGAWAGLNPEVRSNAREVSRQYVCDHYTWKQTAHELENQYEQYLD